MPDTVSGNGDATFRHKADDVIESSFDRAQDGLNKARDGAHKAVAGADDALDTARHYVTEQAQTRPLATLGIAVGVGVILGMLLKR